MLRRALALLLIISIVLPFAACLNPISIDDSGYVVAVGADVGKEKKYEITLELQRASAGTDSEHNGGAIILSVEAEDLFDAVGELSSGISYNLNFTRTHIVLFSQELAEKGMINDFLAVSFDVLRIRRSALMLITHSSVREYIGGLAANDSANIAKMQDFMISGVRRTGGIAAINIARYYEAIEDGRFDPVLPMGYFDDSIITDQKQKADAEKGEDPLADAKKGDRVGGMQGLTLGSALFDGSRLAGTLGYHDTQFMNIGRGDFRQGTVTLTLPDGSAASVFLLLKHRSVKVDTSGDEPTAEMRLQLSITVESDPSGTIGQNWEDGGAAFLTEYIESELARVFGLCKEKNCDAMGFGRYASMNFTNTDDWEDYGWKGSYPLLTVAFTADLVLDDEYIAKELE